MQDGGFTTVSDTSTLPLFLLFTLCSPLSFPKPTNMPASPERPQQQQAEEEMDDKAEEEEEEEEEQEEEEEEGDESRTGLLHQNQSKYP